MEREKKADPSLSTKSAKISQLTMPAESSEILPSDTAILLLTEDAQPGTSLTSDLSTEEGDDTVDASTDPITSTPGSTAADEALAGGQSRASTTQPLDAANSSRRRRKKQQPAGGTPAALTFPQATSSPLIALLRAAPALLAAAAALGGALFLLRRFRNRSQPGKTQTRGDEQLSDSTEGAAEGENMYMVDGPPALVTELELLPSSSDPTLLLTGLTFAVSDVYDVEGHVTRAGKPAGEDDPPPASATAPVLLSLVAAGAAGVAKSATPPLNLGLVGEVNRMAVNFRAPEYVTGGAGGAGAAAVVAGEVSFAMDTDHLAGVRVAAACCGCYGFRPTAGLLPTEGTIMASASLETVAWLADSPDTLYKVGQALGLPGGGPSARTELARIIVAKDIFTGCDESMTAAYGVLLAAARHWATPEQVSLVPLCAFLGDHVPGLAAFAKAEEETTVLDALTDAAEAIQMADLKSHAPDAIPLDDQVTVEMEAAARAVQQQMVAALRLACQGGVILALPALPGPPPRRDADMEEQERFEDRALQLASIAALAGVPQVNIPVLIPGQPPLSIALLGLHKSDMRLLHVANKLGTFITHAVVEASQQGLIANGRPRLPKAIPAAAAQNTTTGAPQQNGTATPSSEPKAAPLNPAEARADKFKEQGNAAFKAGDYDAAVAAYGAAIQMTSRNPVLYSNRAMASLKVMRFAEAEADAERALQLEAPILNPKTLLRRATAREGLQKFRAARSDYNQVLALQPNNRQALDELRALRDIPDELDADLAPRSPDLQELLNM